jgi:site-specific recombinase XerD
MDKITFNTVYNRKKQPRPDGTALIQVEAYLPPKKKYFSTKIYVLPEHWDYDRRQIKTHPNKISLNKQIKAFIAKLETFEDERRQSGKPLTLDYISDRTKGNISTSFAEYCLKSSITEKLNIRTRANHTAAINWMKEFKNDATFEDINFEYLNDFEFFLREKGLHTNTIAKNLTIIRRYVNRAIKAKLFEKNKYPFRWEYTIKKQETHRQYLTPEELEHFENIQLPDDKKHLQLALDKFIFGVYTGLRFGDVNELKPNCLVTENGNEYLKLITGKTNQALKLPVYLPIFSKALDIFYKYAGKHETLFPYQYNAGLNKMLRELAAMAEINKTVTYHVARHTQATCLLYKGVNITTVQKLLGHKKVETTQIYAKVIDEAVKRDLEKITSFSV